jgi:asparagine synthase (glutamine-hydrolysing)
LSAVAAWLARTAPARDRDPVAGLLRAMPARGGDLRQTWRDEVVSLGVSRHAWEASAAHAGPKLVAVEGQLALVADASVYHAEELAARLTSLGAAPAAPDASSLLLAAYRAWGEALTDHVEGDYAFVLWDAARGRALLGRDFVGRRALHVRTLPTGIAVATHASALATLDPPPAVRRDFVAAAASGLLAGSRGTAFSGVMPVAAGATCEWTRTGGLREARRWEPPPFATTARGDVREDALQLRALVERAVAGRCTGDAAVVWLSGGADSTAVFAAGMHAARQGATRATISAASVSFPEGDSAREDDHIRALLESWPTRTEWIDSESMRVFERQEDWAAARQDPYAHTFEAMNRTLGAATRRLGARVAFDGYGGDSLFQVSDASIAEVLSRGALHTWRRLLREGEYADWRSVARWGVLPALPEPAWRLIDVVRGRRLVRPFEQDVAAWISGPMRERLVGEGWTRPEIRRGLLEGPAAYESRWYLTAPYMARSVAWTHDFAQQSGIELRSPLLDRELVRFAAARPVTERGLIPNAKKLLREAMRGLIPDSVLAPREYKTGVPRGYFHRQMAAGFRQLVREVFGEEAAPRPSLLVAGGILELPAFHSALRQYQSTGDHLTGVQLYLTLGAELWLKSHFSGSWS